MTFKVCDSEFEVDTIVLDAFVDTERDLLTWGVEVKASPGLFKASVCHPSVKAESFVSTGPGQLNSWRDLAGTEISWSSALDDYGEERALLYVFEHSRVFSAKIAIFRSDTGGLCISWEGSAGEAERLNFVAAGKLQFGGVWLGRLGEKDSYRLVSRFLDLGKLEYNVTSQGVSVLRGVDL